MVITSGRNFKKIPGQVLLSTLLVLLILSLLVVALGTTVRMNSKQLSGNVQYSQSYNSSDNFLMQTVPVVTNGELKDLASSLEGYLGGLQSNTNVDISCESLPNTLQVTQVVCHFLSGTLRSIIEISDSQEIIEYNLNREEYINLNLGNKSYSQGNLNISWDTEAVLEFTYTYTTTLGGQIKTINQITNSNTGLFSFITPGANTLGFVNTGTNPLVLPMARNIGGVAVLNQSLRIKNLTPDRGITLSVTPSGFATSTEYPSQARLLKALTYDTTKANDSSPVVITTVPINSSLPMTLDSGLTLQSYRSPICGNQILEDSASGLGREQCDDGNSNQSDNCVTDLSVIPNIGCTNAKCGDGQLYTGTGSYEVCDNGVGNGNKDYPNPGQTILIDGTRVYSPSVVPTPAGTGGCNRSNIKYPGSNINTPVKCNYCKLETKAPAPVQQGCSILQASGPYCGDGIKDTGIVTTLGGSSTESCDLGASNGVVCTPAAGEGNTCTYCKTSCVLTTRKNGKCIAWASAPNTNPITIIAGANTCSGTLGSISQSKCTNTSGVVGGGNNVIIQGAYQRCCDTRPGCCPGNCNGGEDCHLYNCGDCELNAGACGSGQSKYPCGGGGGGTKVCTAWEVTETP